MATSQDGPRTRLAGLESGQSQPPYNELNLATHVGDSQLAVSHNRDLLIEAIGGASAGTHVIGAAHSANVVVVSAEGDQVTEGVDALVTRIPNLALLGLGADCAVITFADAYNGVAAVAHCGWQGLVKGIISATVAALEVEGASPDQILATIGPSICGQCYEVDTDRAGQVEAVTPAAVFEQGSRYGIDIALGAATQLSECGVTAISSGVCTYESDRHFSFRRDGQTGRQGAAIVLRRDQA